MWCRTLDCLGVAVAVRAPATLAARLDSVFRGYSESDGEPVIRYELNDSARPAVMRDGRVARRLDARDDLVPALELDLYREVVARAEGLVLHAGAVVGRGGRAIVVAGRSGAGKSTLVRALLVRGLGYLTEECVALGDGAACRGLSRPLHVDDDALAVPPGFGCDDYVIRVAGDGARRLRLFHVPERQIWRGSARAVAIVDIDHAPGVTPAMEPMSVGQALVSLWPASFRTDAVALDSAARALVAVRLLRLRTCASEQAIAHVVDLADEMDVAPV